MKVHHYSKALSWITRPRVTETATAETYTPELERMNFKPEKSKADQYKEYLKAEPFLEPESQIYARDQLGFDEGGSAQLVQPGQPGVRQGYGVTLTKEHKKNIKAYEKTFNKKYETLSGSQQYKVRVRGAEMYPPGMDPASHLHKPKYIEDPSYLYDRKKLLKKIQEMKGTFKELENTPEFKKYIKENKIDYSIGDAKQAKERANIRRRFARAFLRQGTIGLKELAEYTPYEHNTLKGMFRFKEHKITKSTPTIVKNKINNAKRLYAELEKILPPLSVEEWYSAEARGAGYRFLEPNKNQIKKLQEFALRDSFFHPKTIDKMHALFKDKKLMNAFGKFDGDTIPKYIMDSIFKEGVPSDKTYALRVLGRILQGKGEVEGIAKNKVLGNKIVAAMFYDASRKGIGSSVWTESYRYARQEMSKYADKGLTFDQLANNIKAEFKELNKSLPKNSRITKIAIDEVFPVRTGMYELKGADAYSNFVQFIDRGINSSAKVSFDGASTKRARKIIAELKKPNPDYELVKNVAQNQDTEIAKFYKNNPDTRGKVNLQRFRWDEANKRFMNPKEIFETQYKGRYETIPSKIREGMEKFYGKTGLSIDPGKALTMTEAEQIIKGGKVKVTKDILQKGKMWNQVINNSKAQTMAKALELAGVTGICSSQRAALGGRIGFQGKVCGLKFAQQDPNGFMRMAQASDAAQDAFKSGKIMRAFKGAKNWARANLGPAGIIGGELLFMGLGTAWEMSQGKGWKEALDEWTGLGGHFGQAEARLREVGAEQGYSEEEINEAMKIGQLGDISTEYETKAWKLGDIQEQQDIGGTARVKYPKGPGAYKPIQGLYQDPIRVRQLKKEVSKLWEKGTELYESLKDYPASADIYGVMTEAKELEEKEKKAKIVDWMTRYKILAETPRYASGGLTRTVASDSGSVSRGLRSLYNRVRRK